MREVSIIGVGIHKFGRFGDKSYIAMGQEAAQMALKDAIDQAVVYFVITVHKNIAGPRHIR